MSQSSRRNPRRFDFMLLFFIIVVGLLFLFLFNQPIRMQAGGKVSVISLSIAAGILIFLQKPVQEWINAKSRERKREGMRRFWREREERERKQREYDLKKQGVPPATSETPPTKQPSDTLR